MLARVEPIGGQTGTRGRGAHRTARAGAEYHGVGRVYLGSSQGEGATRQDRDGVHLVSATIDQDGIQEAAGIGSGAVHGAVAGQILIDIAGNDQAEGVGDCPRSHHVHIVAEGRVPWVIGRVVPVENLRRGGGRRVCAHQRIAVNRCSSRHQQSRGNKSAGDSLRSDVVVVVVNCVQIRVAEVGLPKHAVSVVKSGADERPVTVGARGNRQDRTADKRGEAVAVETGDRRNLKRPIGPAGILASFKYSEPRVRPGGNGGIENVIHPLHIAFHITLACSIHEQVFRAHPDIQ